MDEKILSFIPKIYFPSNIFLGNRSFLFFKTIQNEKSVIVVSSAFKKLNGDLLNEIFDQKTNYFIQENEPTLHNFNNLKNLCLKEKPTYLIAIGGGSVIDLVKLVKRDLKIKMIAVPTTIGSGAEVSQHALIVNEDKKDVQSSSFLVPETIIINPICLKSLTKEQIFWQSIDAFAHSFESLVSRISNPLSDTLALTAIEDIYVGLEDICKGSMNEKTIEQLQISASLAGFAQSSAATGLVHSFAHYVGAKNKISHSKAVSMFFLDVLELNSKKTDKYQKLNRLKSLSSKNFIRKIRELFVKFNIKPEKITLENSLEEAADIIKKDICTVTNPYPPTIEDIIEILKKHLHD